MSKILDVINKFVDEDKRDDLKNALLEETNKNTSEKKSEVKLTFANTGQYIPVEKLNEKNDEIKSLNKQGETFTKQIEELKNSKNVSEEAKKEIADLQEKNNKSIKDFGIEKNNLVKKYELVGALKNVKAKGVNLLASQVIADEKLSSLITIDGDKINGVDTVIKKLKENEEYKDLFSEVIETKMIGTDPMKLQLGDDELQIVAVDTLEKELQEAKKNKDLARVMKLRNQIDLLKQEK